MNSALRHFWTINLTLMVALMLTLFPLPNWAEPFRPEWLTLAIIYWCMSLPKAIGLRTSFTFGVLLDIAMGTLLGQHALGICIIAYIFLKNHQRIRLYPIVQQGFIVMIALLIKQILFLWIYGITKRAPENLWLYFMPSIISMLLWPWVYAVMRDIQGRFLPAHR